MRSTVVPAQVTTVEDKVAGNLGMSQLVLLATPVFIGGILYVILPPFTQTATYKLLVIAIVLLICSLLAVRVKGTLVLQWLLVLVRYNTRPRYYVFDKRSMHGRQEVHVRFEAEPVDERAEEIVKVPHTSLLSTADVVNLHDIIENPAANLSFETNRKGKLYVRITEVKPES